ncbi:hypothetical protein [Enterococcus sp. AZ109]|uniref:hypothetical protein n=1 Tax=Enterococcus sp. AZ109 TaxID=2774634 RepID=UPI003F240918
MIDTISLEMNNLVYTEVKTVPDNFLSLVLQSEELLFEEGYYKNGPTLIEIKPTEMELEEQTYKFYIPVNEPVDNGNSKLVDNLHFDKLLRQRVPFDDGIDVALESMKAILQENDIQYADKLLMAMIVVYGEYWVDLMIPILE